MKEYTRHLCKSFIKQNDGSFSEAIAWLASIVVTALRVIKTINENGRQFDQDNIFSKLMAINSHHTLISPTKKRGQRYALYYFPEIYHFNSLYQIRFYFISFLSLNDYSVYSFSQEYKQDNVTKGSALS
jgi:hypothetical protein